MLQRLRESLALFLIALLPFHAFMVTVKTRWLLGPGHAPMGEIAIWKEVVLAVILVVALIEIASSFQLSSFRKKIDVIDILIGFLLAIGVFVSINNQLSTTSFAYGFRYDFIPLIAFVILRRVAWSDVFLKRAMITLVTVGCIVAAYGIISFFLSASFFTWLGYSDLHSLYVPGGPVAPYQQIGGTALRRIQSVMSGPNQLGLWLLVPLAAVLAKIPDPSHKIQQKVLDLGMCFLVLAALLLTFSRAAWIGAAVIIGMSMWPMLQSMSRRKVTGLLSSMVCLLVIAVLMFPSVFLRFASSRGHIENPLRAIHTMIDHPLGLGLGTAGPASNRTSDACVMLEAGADASWATAHSDLCVFVAGAQVQPLDRTCNCPFLPENWYLQIGVEMGWIGLAMYLALVIVVIQRLWRIRYPISDIRYQISKTVLVPAFLALSIAAMFLHAWEDSAVAYTVWMLMAVVLGLGRDRR